MQIVLSCLSPLPLDVFMVCVCRRVSPTCVSALTATRASTVTGARSLQPAGGSAVGTGSVACQRQESRSATVSQATADPHVKLVRERGGVRETGERGREREGNDILILNLR